jgi:chromosome segregation ATPase
LQGQVDTCEAEKASIILTAEAAFVVYDDQITLLESDKASLQSERDSLDTLVHELESANASLLEQVNQLAAQIADLQIQVTQHETVQAQLNS